MCTCGNCSPACRRRAYDRRRHRDDPRRRAAVVERLERWRDSKRFFVTTYLMNHPCVDCDEADPIVLEFDHVRGVKVGNVATMISSGSTFQKLMDEIAKCEVRCANCHRRKTHRLKQYRNRYTGPVDHLGD